MTVESIENAQGAAGGAAGGATGQDNAPAAAQDNAPAEDGQTDLMGELHRLKEEHRDLDSAIDALERNVVADQLQIQRLKKRKLTLRDRIAYVEDQLTPDIIA